MPTGLKLVRPSDEPAETSLPDADPANDAGQQPPAGDPAEPPAAPAPAADAGGIELRGVMQTPLGPLFSIYNTARRKSAFVGLNVLLAFALGDEGRSGGFGFGFGFV